MDADVEGGLDDGVVEDAAALGEAGEIGVVGDDHVAVDVSALPRDREARGNREGEEGDGKEGEEEPQDQVLGEVAGEMRPGRHDPRRKPLRSGRAREMRRRAER